MLPLLCKPVVISRARKRDATSPARSRSRFFVNTVPTHTRLSIQGPRTSGTAGLLVATVNSQLWQSKMSHIEVVRVRARSRLLSETTSRGNPRRCEMLSISLSTRSPTVGPMRPRPRCAMIDWDAVLATLADQFTLNTMGAHKTTSEKPRAYLRHLFVHWSKEGRIKRTG